MRDSLTDEEMANLITKCPDADAVWQTGRDMENPLWLMPVANAMFTMGDVCRAPKTWEIV